MSGLRSRKSLRMSESRLVIAVVAAATRTAFFSQWLSHACFACRISSIARRIAGDRRARVRVDLRGRSDFERDVLLKAAEIPHGEVRPYGWIAAEIGRPKAVRAVGTALGHNPVPLIVPCHRVVRTDGTIGHYSLGGPENKRAILAAEGLDPDAFERRSRAGAHYTGSRTTHIVCNPTCRHARRVMDKHRVWFRSLDAAADAGYRPCKVCRPASGAGAVAIPA